tara:strand:- start:763 stop:879 length:117 start_codon:yes stop_codon:yes gene_type:complete
MLQYKSSKREKVKKIVNSLTKSLLFLKGREINVMMFIF